jgi:excisionase family DNA binding protein
MPVNRSSKQVLPKSEQPRDSINWGHLLHTALGEIRTHIVQNVTVVEGLRLLVMEVLERLDDVEAHTEGDQLLVPVSIAAQLLSLSEKTIMRRIKNGELVGVKDGDVLRVTKASITSYIKRNRIGGGSEDDAN